MSTLENYPRRYCTVCGHVVRRRFKLGPGGEPNRSCPRCRSLERHRFLAIVLDVLKPVLNDVDLLLDIGPTEQTTELLARLEPRRSLRLDLGADDRAVDVLGSIVELPLPDASVDVMLCYHILEHVPDDRAAMREIARVLSPGGIGIVQVPYRPGTVTDEDPTADADERIRRFGQADHVRYYGDDFEDRLVESGLSLQRITPLSLVGRQMGVWLRLNPIEMVWLVRPAADATVPPRARPEPTPLTRAFDAILGELAEQHETSVALRARCQELEEQNARMRRVLAPALRARSAARSLARRLGRDSVRTSD